MCPCVCLTELLSNIHIQGTYTPDKTLGLDLLIEEFCFGRLTYKSFYSNTHTHTDQIDTKPTLAGMALNTVYTKVHMFLLEHGYIHPEHTVSSWSSRGVHGQLTMGCGWVPDDSSSPPPPPLLVPCCLPLLLLFCPLPTTMHPLPFHKTVLRIQHVYMCV